MNRNRIAARVDELEAERNQLLAELDRLEQRRHAALAALVDAGDSLTAVATRIGVTRQALTKYLERRTVS